MNNKVTASQFVSGHTRAQWAVILLALVCVIDVVALVSGYTQIDLLSRAQRGIDVAPTAVVTANAWQQTVELTQLLVRIVTGLVFFAWIHRAYRNLYAFDVPYLNYSPGWAVAGFLVPFLNFVRPFRVVREIWRASDPTALAQPNWETTVRASPLITAWWLLFLVSGVIGRLANAILRTGAGETLSSLQSALWVGLTSDLLSIPAALLAIVLIQKIDGRQENTIRLITTQPLPEPPAWGARTTWLSAGLTVVLLLAMIVRVNTSQLGWNAAAMTADGRGSRPTSTDPAQGDARDAHTHNLRGVTFSSQGNYDLAIDAFNRAIALQPKNAVFHYNRGSAYYFLGKYDRAIEDFNEAIALDPKFVAAYYNRGSSYSDQGQYTQAIKDYNQAIELDPSLAPPYNNRGLAFAEQGDYDKALADYDQAIELDPQYATAYFNRGNLYVELGDHARAVTDYSQALDLDLQTADVYSSRGNAHRYLEEYDEAIADYTAAIALSPKDFHSYNQRGLVYVALGDNDQAIADFEQAIRLDPKNATLYFNRGFIYRKIGEYEQALSDFDRAIQLQPDDADLYYYRGATYADIGKKSQAITDLEKALELGLNAERRAKAEALLAELE